MVEHGTPTAGFRAAMLANANLCGDNVNRGVLLGAILGAVVGASNLPADLVEGLHRREEAKSAGEGLAALVAVTAAVTASQPRRAAPFGRPWPLPIASYGRETPVRAPRDLPTKLRAIAADAARAGVPATQVWYDRHAGPLLLQRVPPPFVASTGLDVQPAGHATVGPASSACGGTVLVVRGSPRAAAGSASAARSRKMDQGVAAADAAEVLAALGGSAAAAVPQVGAAAGGNSRLEELHPSVLSRLAPVLENGLWHRVGEGGGEAVSVAPGTGIAWYPHEEEVASLGSGGEVSASLAALYGLKVAVGTRTD